MSSGLGRKLKKITSVSPLISMFLVISYNLQQGLVHDRLNKLNPILMCWYFICQDAQQAKNQRVLLPIRKINLTAVEKNSILLLTVCVNLPVRRYKQCFTGSWSIFGSWY
jgi:hypothetical protein